jgi:hypothetical protein
MPDDEQDAIIPPGWLKPPDNPLKERDAEI